MRVRYMSVKHNSAKELKNFPNFHASGSVWGMKRFYYGENALLVRCGQWIYNVTDRPELYWMAK